MTSKLAKSSEKCLLRGPTKRPLFEGKQGKIFIVLDRNKNDLGCSFTIAQKKVQLDVCL